MSLDLLQANLVQPQTCSCPIFVLGAPQSGTRELARALAQHSQLASHDESEFLAVLLPGDQVSNVFQMFHKRLLPTYVGMHGVKRVEFLGCVGMGVNALFTSRNPGKRWIDCTAEYTLMATSLAELFPDALFIHLLRDGRRVVQSMTGMLDHLTDVQRGNLLKDGQLPPWATDFRAACKTWAKHVDAALDFAATHPRRCFRVIHEELSADPEAGFRAILAFLQVPHEDRPAHCFRNPPPDAPLQRQALEPPAVENMAEPIRFWTRAQVAAFTEESGEDGEVRKVLTPDQKNIFIREAGPTLIRAGLIKTEDLERWGKWKFKDDFPVERDVERRLRRLSAEKQARDPSDAVIDIHEVVRSTPAGEPLWGFGLESPKADSRTDAYAVKMSGWVVGRRAPATAVEIRYKGMLIRTLPLRIPRQDVARQFPQVKEAEQSGFGALVSVLGMAPEFQLHLHAVLRDESRVPLGVIRGTHRPIRSPFEATLRPLMVTSIGRAGTTWLMRLLAEHPRVVANRVYPYETKSAGYWIHMLKILAEPANHFQSAHPDTFATNQFWTGSHPFNTDHPARQAERELWYDREYPEQLAGFSQRMIESYYRRVAQSQGQTEPLYFAEKFTAGQLPWLTWELFPESREVFLVRDFRDVLCSILAFNAKRGFEAFGRSRSGSDEEYIQRLQATYRRLQTNYQERSKRGHLVRYEDLVTYPRETMTGLLRYLDLDHSPETLDGLLHRASEETSELKQHKTSSSATSSIGRWKRDLTPPLQALCWKTVGDVLQKFGYTDK
jgi:hypothetical protein